MPGRRGAAGPVWRRRVAAVAVAAVVAALVTASAGAGPAGAAAPTDLYVTMAGNDANPCSVAAPCASVQRAVTVAAGGTATIHVGPGTFPSAVDIASGTITIEGDPAGTTLGATSGSTVTVHAGDVTLTGLTVADTDDSTLAINQFGGRLVVDTSTVHGADGGIAGQGGTLTIIASTLTGGRNIGVLTGSGTTTIITSTITASALGIQFSDGPVVIKNSTIAGNGSTGILSDFGETGRITMSGTVLARNGGLDCELIGGRLTDSGYNLADDSSCGFHGIGSRNAVTDLALGALASNGGPTRTIAPAATSPAVDAIPAGNALCTGTDQRGVVRPQGAGCDAGAVELAGTTVTPSSSVNPSYPGQPVPLTVTVASGASAPANQPTPAGTVSVSDGTTAITGCTGLALNAGTANCTTSALAPGQHTLTATYTPAATSPYLPGSGALAQTVNPAPSIVYVAFGGTNAGNYTCTQANPCATVQHAIDIAAPTVTVHVGTGSFSGPTTVDSGTVTIVGDPAGTTLETASGNTVTVNGTADLTLEGLVIRSKGTGIAQNGGILTVTASTIASNDDFGIDESDGTLTVVDSTIVGNGVGLADGAGTMTITSSTIVENTHFGITQDETEPGVITLAGSVLASSNWGDCGVPTIVDGGFNLADDSSCGFTGTSRDGVTGLGLSPLAFIGGATPVEMPALGGPAVNAIPADNALCTGTDQRGVARPQGTACDAGAVELAATTTTLTATQNPASANQPTLRVTVTSDPSTPANLPKPAGMVTVTEGGKALSACTGLVLADGAATCPGGTLPAGEHALTATFTPAGTSPTLPSSGSATLFVLTAPVITSGDKTTFTIGAAGTFTVTTTGIPAATLTESGALPTGITFADNGDGTATLAGIPAAGTAGTYLLTVSAQNRLGTAHQTLTLTVTKATATVTVTVEPAHPVTGAPMTVRVHVTGAAGTPTGTVSIDDPATVTLADGAASLAVTAPAAGPLTVTADYGGDTTYAPATGTVRAVVAAAPPTQTPTSPPPTSPPPTSPSSTSPSSTSPSSTSPSSTSPSSPTEPPAASPSQATSSLASTGGNLRLPLLAGLILLTAGVAVLTRTRRSRRH